VDWRILARNSSCFVFTSSDDIFLAFYLLCFWVAGRRLNKGNAELWPGRVGELGSCCGWPGVRVRQPGNVANVIFSFILGFLQRNNEKTEKKKEETLFFLIHS
jgi:hypothetical protein